MHSCRPLLLLILSSLPTFSAASGSLTCTVDGSRDSFVVYPAQQVFNSAQFSYYQMMDGLTVLILNKRTQGFNRLSNLNLLPHSSLDPHWPAEAPQLFSGHCSTAAD